MIGDIPHFELLEFAIIVMGIFAIIGAIVREKKPE